MTAVVFFIQSLFYILHVGAMNFILLMIKKNQIMHLLNYSELSVSFSKLLNEIIWKSGVSIAKQEITIWLFKCV